MEHIAWNSQRFEAFVRVHRPLLLQVAGRLCRHGRFDPEDLVQETLERALQDFVRLSGLNETAQRAWLGTTLTNRFMDCCRRQRTEVMGLPSLRVVHEQTTLLEGSAREKWETVSEDALRDAVGLLKPRLREAYAMHAAGLRYKEIAQKLQAPIGTVGSWISEARLELRQLLSERTGGRP